LQKTVYASIWRIINSGTHHTVVAVSALSLFTLVGLAGLAAAWPQPTSVRTEDRNRDGRPDVWETVGPDGELVSVAIDTNFDGRPDVRLQYSGGDLVRLESDSNFDDRVDLVEEFDSVTHEIVRSVIDVDKDGTADLLVLSQGGRPVFVKWTDQFRAKESPSAASDETDRRAAARLDSHRDAATHGATLLPMADPFATDLTVRGTPPSRGWQLDGLRSTSGGLPLSVSSAFNSLMAPGRCSSPERRLNSPLASTASPRGPPAAPLHDDPQLTRL
jgi:hypothetical protein